MHKSGAALYGLVYGRMQNLRSVSPPLRHQTAAYAEFQYWPQNMLTFERLAKTLSKKNMNWFAFIMRLFMKLFPLLMSSQHTGEEGKRELFEVWF
jgi:hypothetical protein